MPANEVVSVRNGKALIVTFNRPDAQNQLTFDMANQAFTILKNATTDRSVRAVLLNGTGGNFMAGLDMALFDGDFSKGSERHNQIVAPYHSAIRELQAMDKPVVACVQGQAFGTGFSFLLASDWVLAGRGATFSCQTSRCALSPDGACSYFLPRKVGVGRAVELMMSGRVFDAQEAERIGIVTKVVDDAALEAEAMSLVSALAEGPTRAYGAIKKLALSAFSQDMSAHLGLEHTYLGACVRGFDFREWLRAKAAGRDPTFTGS